MANDFLPFGTSGAANVNTNVEYTAEADRLNGNQPGIAKSKLVNKALRQSSIMSAVLAQFNEDLTGANSVDDGTSATLLANLKLATKGRVGTPIASAATTSVGAYITGDTMHITGTTTITSLGVSVTGTKKDLIFDGILTVTHNATSLILPGNLNIVTAVGAVGKFVCENGALGYWKCTGYSSIGNPAPLSSPAFTEAPTLNGSLLQTQSFRNRIINGNFRENQINDSTAVIVTAGAALLYTTDQWFAYCTGANVTAQRVAGSLQSPFRQRFTGVASVTKIGFAQRMEASMTYDMNNGLSMIGVDMSNSLLTTVTWKASYANTIDTFGTLAVPTKTQIATGTITVSPILGRYFIPISIPSAATTGIEIEFSVGAQISGTWVIGNAQFEKIPTGATTGTDFEFLPADVSMTRCQRYFELVKCGYIGSPTAATVSYGGNFYMQTKRVAPTASFLSDGGTSQFATGVPTVDEITTNGFRAFKNNTSAGGQGFWSTILIMNAQL